MLVTRSKFEITKLLLIFKFYKYVIFSFLNITYYYKMKKLEVFEIHVERPSQTYFPGELIKGHLLVNVSERLNINSLSVLLKGSGRVWWETSSGDASTTYSEEEEYLNCNLVLLTKQQNETECDLEAGEKAYPFQIQLPQNLPSSSKDAHAGVIYSLKGIIELPLGLKKIVNLLLDIIEQVDLNNYPSLRQPATGLKTKIICCCCCKSDPIIAKVSILKCGYVPGEELVFNASIDNKSNYVMKSISLKIIQNVLWITRRGSRIIRRQSAEIVWPKKIDKKKYDEWNNTSVTIPSTCSSSIGNSKIFKIFYCAVLHVNPAGPYCSFEASIPIVIGTVPLTNDLN